MKTEIAVPILVAVIAAGASIAGVLYNQHGSLELERQKWEQSVATENAKAEREAMSEFAKQFSTSFYLAENMIWRAEMRLSSLTLKDFEEYARASDKQKPKLATAEVLLATTSHELYAKVAPLLAEYRRIDEQLIVSGPQIKAAPKRVLGLLNSEVKRFPAFQKLMVESLSNTTTHAVSTNSSTK